MGGAVDVDSSAGDVVGVDSPEEGVICVNPDTLGVWWRCQYDSELSSPCAV